MHTAARTQLTDEAVSSAPISTDAAARCDYCQLPLAVPAAVSNGSAEPLFCCYGCRLAAQITQSRGEAGQVNWLLTRLGISAFLSMGVMVFTLYLYGQEIYRGAALDMSPLETNLAGIMQYLSLLFATPVLVMLGLPILNNAVGQLRVGVITTDALIVLGVAAAFVYSYVSTLGGSGATYFETTCMILVLVTFGRWLEATGRLKASEHIKSLAGLVPAEVPVKRAGRLVTVKTEEVQAGDIVVARAGQRIPVDGVILEGQASFDEQIITGESAATAKAPGDTATAGTIPLDGTLIVRATGVGVDSTIARFVKILEEARAVRGRYQRLADRVARLFVPATILLAGVGAWLGYARAGLDEAIMSGLAVMLIACPCALGIATPLAVWAGLGLAAKRGVLLRNSEALEQLGDVAVFCFDKTGTLTTGAAVVADLRIERQRELDRHQVLALAAGLAEASTHTFSRSIAAYANEQDVLPEAVRDVRTVPGRGIIGLHQGLPVALGNLEFMHDNDTLPSAALQKEVHAVLSSEAAIACLSVGDQVVGVFSLAESLRPHAQRAVEQLQAMGRRVHVLTGDHAPRAQAMAHELGVEVSAQLGPDDTITQLRHMQACGARVAMVGDGLNDAPALAAADVGIALGCGADLSRESADVCLLGDDLEVLPGLVKLAGRTVRTIRLNLFWAFFYNMIGVCLALGGVLNPMIAAGAMVLSSALVVTNSLRLANDAWEVTP